MGFFASFQAFIFAAIYAFPVWKSHFSICGFTHAMEKTTSQKVDQICKPIDDDHEFEPIETPRTVIKTELLKHQKEGLGWMVQRENSDDLPPFWEMKDGKYVNVLINNFTTDTAPESLRGGILADDLGLGKTLTLLSLIAYDKEQREIVIVNNNNKRKEAIRESEEGCSSQKRCRTIVNCQQVSVVNSSDMKTRATLIVCPSSKLSMWRAQLEEHCIRGSLKTYLYYGNKRTKDVHELMMHDLVLTTYDTISREELLLDTKVIKKIEWWRIILDDAHVIRTMKNQKSQAVKNLNANRRWAATGTPIQNGLQDLFAIMVFLKIDPFTIKRCRDLVQKPHDRKEGLSYLQDLMSTISLRRKNDNGLVGLSPKTIETHYVELSSEERDLYDQMKEESKKMMVGYIDDDIGVQRFEKAKGIIERLQQITLDHHLPMCPSDLKSVLPSANIEDVTNHLDLLESLIEVLERDDKDFQCPICVSTPTNIVITCCSHVFCRDCIITSIQCSKPCCPICRAPLTLSNLFSYPLESSRTLSSNARLSSKISTLIKLLIDSSVHVTKSVVFSQYHEMLILLEEPLKAAGFKTLLYLEREMNAKQLAHVIEEFGMTTLDKPMVLLSSLKVSSANLDLTAASRIYIMEPWWNPAIEEHRINLVHRVGQNNSVHITKLVNKDTIEQKILMLQEKKKELGRETSEKRSWDLRMNMDDMRFLLFD